MDRRVYPYVIFLPKGSKYEVLRAVFGSSVLVDLLKIALRKGFSLRRFIRGT